MFYICTLIVDNYDISAPLNELSLNPRNVLQQLLSSVPQDRKILIMIDGLNMFYDLGRISEAIFPYELPSNVRLIASSIDDSTNWLFLDEPDVLHIEPFGRECSLKALQLMLESHNRLISNRFQSQTIQESIGCGVSPLHLKLIAEICATWRSDTLCCELPETDEAIALAYIKKMYKEFGHDCAFVKYALAFIAVAPYGIAEDELQYVLFGIKEIRKSFDSNDRYGYRLDRMPFVIWSRLFYDLKDCLTLAWSSGAVVVKFSHSIYEGVVKSQFKSFCDEATISLCEYYLAQPDYHSDNGKPNLRKAYSLLPLLKKEQRWDDIINLFQTISFVDILIKAVGIEQVLLEMRSLIKEAAGRYSTDGILQILKCLQNNREYLSYYPDEFACCAYSAGLSVPFKPVIECEQVDDVQKNTKYYYPYSPYAKISWCLDKNKYAVYKDTSIFICELENQSEICAIHTDIAANNSRVINVDWLSTDKLLVVLSTNVILIYSISNDRSILWKRFECSSSCVKCVNVNEFLSHTPANF